MTKPYGISNLIYSLTNMEVDTAYLQQAQRLINNFIWNGPNRVKHSTLISDYDMGGLKVTDMNCMMT